MIKQRYPTWAIKNGHDREISETVLDLAAEDC